MCTIMGIGIEAMSDCTTPSALKRVVDDNDDSLLFSATTAKLELQLGIVQAIIKQIE